MFTWLDIPWNEIKFKLFLELEFVFLLKRCQGWK